MSNEFQNSDKENIISFIKKESLFKNKDYIIEYEKLISFSNNNYVIIIKDRKSNEVMEKYIYRKFGKMSLTYDKKIEKIIIKYLYEKGIGPNILYEEKYYRISEYLYDSKNLDLDQLFDDYIMQSLYKILNIYNLISYIYSYKFNNDKILLKKIDSNKIKIPCEVTHYNNIMEKFYKKANTNFKIFEKKFNENISKNREYNNYFVMINDFFKNFDTLYKNNIPSEGIMVLNHNDCFNLNIMMRQKDKKIFLIDNEYAALNLIGYDIAFYICESHFNNDILYNFSIPKIDVEKCFKNYYMKFINEFMINNYINLNEDLIGQIKSKKYYIKLNLLSSLFLLVFDLCFIDYENWEKNKDKDYYFSDSVYRINLYNYFKSQLDKI